MRQLTVEQQDLVTANLGRAYAVAHQVWRQARLPARYWDELCGEAVLEACLCAARYLPGKMPFVEVMSFQVRKHLWRWLHAWKAAELLGARVKLLLAVVMDEDERVDLLLRLLPALPDRQRQVLELRYGLTGDGVKSHQEVSLHIGIALSPVKRAEQRGLDNLRRLYQGDLHSLSLAEARKLLSRGGDRRSKKWQIHKHAS